MVMRYSPEPFAGDIAVLTGVQIAGISLPNGTALTSRVMLTNVFRRENERWCMVLSYAFELVHSP